MLIHADPVVRRRGNDEERKRGRERGEWLRWLGERGGGKENLETIGGAEAAAFHVGWHRLPLKSLLLFVSSSKIMIVCPRDLLPPRPSQCGTTWPWCPPGAPKTNSLSLSLACSRTFGLQRLEWNHELVVIPLDTASCYRLYLYFSATSRHQRDFLPLFLLPFLARFKVVQLSSGHRFARNLPAQISDCLNWLISRGD